MRTSRHRGRPATVAALIVFAAAAAALGPAPAGAQVVVSDNFSDGLGNSAANPLDAAWLQLNGSTTLNTQTDNTAPLSGAALNFDHNGTTLDRPFVGVFSLTPLAVGETITLAFDLRRVDLTFNNASGIRFGLYAQGPDTAVAFSSDTSTAAGYFATAGAGTSPGVTVQREVHDAATGNDERVLWNGDADDSNDWTNLTLAGATPSAINDNAPRRFSFALTRQATGYSLALSLDGSLIAAGSDATQATAAFDMIGFALAGDSPTNQAYHLDNVSVAVSSAAVPVPETGGLGLSVTGLLGALTAAGLRYPRRRRS